MRQTDLGLVLLARRAPALNEDDDGFFLNADGFGRLMGVQSAFLTAFRADAGRFHLHEMPERLERPHQQIDLHLRLLFADADRPDKLHVLRAPHGDVAEAVQRVRDRVESVLVRNDLRAEKQIKVTS